MYTQYMRIPSTAQVQNGKRSSYKRFQKFFGESPSGKASDFDSDIRRFDPYLPSQILNQAVMGASAHFIFARYSCPAT